MARKLLLLRHAERPEIPQGEVGNDLLLTEAGKNHTIRFSQDLENIVSIHSSPVARCVQTAEIIAGNCGYDKTQIKLSNELGDPGFFISDAHLAWKNWQEKGSDVVSEYLLSDKDQWEGFHPLDQAVQKFSNAVAHKLISSREGTHVWVTHDTILAAYASRVLPENLTLKQWPNFLGYLEILLSSEGHLRFIYMANSKVATLRQDWLN